MFQGRQYYGLFALIFFTLKFKFYMLVTDLEQVANVTLGHSLVALVFQQTHQPHLKEDELLLF